jgi:hypothetical protein
MSEDVDNGVEEQLSTAARTAFVAASQVAQVMMSKRQQEARAATGLAEAEGRELTGRFDAELVAAEAHLQRSYDQQWWATASVEGIGQMYGTAQAWSEYSPVAASAAAMMQAEVRSRYGAEIKDLLDEAAADRQDGDEQRVREHEDRAEAERLVAGELTGQDAQATAGGFDVLSADERSLSGARSELAYDSAERRAGTAADLETAGYEKQAIAARMITDLSNAEPARAAVSTSTVGPLKVRGRGGIAGLDTGRDVGSR